MKILVNTVVVFLLWISSSSSALAESGFQVVVHPANSVNSVDQKYLAEIFLKKKIYWPDNRGIFVVDMVANSDVRRQFSERILDRPVSAVRNYWQQLLFSGRGVPPPELKSEQEVLEFIASHEDAIGYVSGSADVGGLKAVKIK
jgi:ABC-type phosphate transport system substrate-binding protein